MTGKDLRFVLLFDIYGELLSDTQKEMFDLYYNDDLSLSEVAENTGITRQGVRDSIKRSEEILLSYEKKLGLAARMETIHTKSVEAEKLLLRLKEKYPQASEDLDGISALLDSIKL